jgi:3-isopropylmalate/(R)-2-methylmalate dehydratase small subunit
MQPFDVLTAVAVPLRIDKIDTGMILPGRFMRRHRRPGHDYATAFLHDVRFDENDSPRADCPLNADPFRDARILVTGADFGCGSSREGAAYAVLDYGLRAIVAPSFGEIFATNCLQNGILAIRLAPEDLQRIWDQLEQGPERRMTVDLPAQRLCAPDGTVHAFEINPTRKERLVQGFDDIDITLQHIEAIDRHEARRRARRPWLDGRSV